MCNEYFVEQCSAVETGSTLPNLQPQGTCSLSELPINKEKILRLIRSLDSNKAHGFDGISVAMINICYDCLVEQLSLIYNACLETGVYPSCWKSANIIPVHKKGSRQEKKNYRPISLLPIFGKILEKVIFDEMYEYLCNYQNKTNGCFIY